MAFMCILSELRDEPRVCGDPCAGQVGGRIWRRNRHMVDYLALESVTMKPWYFLDSAYGYDSMGSI